LAPNKKATGPDGIPYEGLKILQHFCPEVLHEIINTLWLYGNIPEEWCEGTLVLLHKKGDKSSLANYRGITLLPAIWKIFMKLINIRIVNHCDKNEIITQFQAGFRKRRGCLQQIHTLYESIIDSRDKTLPAFLLFVDFKSAYDSIWQDALWYKLKKIGIAPHMIECI